MRARCAGALSCWNKVVTRHPAYRWQQYDVIMTSWSSIKEVSKRYHQNFLLCNNNEITACTEDLLNSFCEEVYAIAFFKVVQQQTIGKVGNSIKNLWKDNLCLQQWKKILKSDSICESYAQLNKGPVFWLTVYMLDRLAISIIDGDLEWPSGGHSNVFRLTLYGFMALIKLSTKHTFKCSLCGLMSTQSHSRYGARFTKNLKTILRLS